MRLLQLVDNRLRQMAFFVFVKVGKWRISHYVEMFRHIFSLELAYKKVYL